MARQPAFLVNERRSTDLANFCESLPLSSFLNPGVQGKFR